MARQKVKREPEYLEDVEIIDAGAEGMSVAKPEGRVVFIPFGVPGDVVDIEVYKRKKNFFEGKILNFKKRSDKRVEPVCQHFGLCGGCKWQHEAYEWQIFYKQKQVKDNFDRIGKIEYPEIRPIIGCEKQFHYRNKLEYTFSNRKWLTDGAPTGTHDEDACKGLGFHLPQLFDRVVDIEQCHLQADPSNDIRLFVRRFTMERHLPYYNFRAHEGLLRNLVIRCNSKGEFMVILVVSEENDVVRHELMPALEMAFPQIVSLLLVINPKLNDIINDLPFECLKGEPYLIETMKSPRPGFDDLKFRIGSVSFFQTNVYQAERLYKTAFDLAEVQGDELMYDLYAGDMAKVFTDDFIETNGRPDLIVTDPPRAGMAEKVVEQLLKIRAQKIVYVSCNPATQARDLQLLDSAYKVMAVQPVDMFPHTQHVENVCLLKLREP